MCKTYENISAFLTEHQRRGCWAWSGTEQKDHEAAKAVREMEGDSESVSLGIHAKNKIADMPNDPVLSTRFLG